MPTQALIAEHRKVQDAAKAALEVLTEAIGADDTEQSIAERGRVTRTADSAEFTRGMVFLVCVGLQES
ncbi:MAG TPA: hypothetical protein VN676_14080 [Steroidobacteraceae bacterium]|nr:hypothetical protein [Steroidobacteraceae bacterium]